MGDGSNTSSRSTPRNHLLALPAALILAGALVLPASCGERMSTVVSGDAGPASPVPTTGPPETSPPETTLTGAAPMPADAATIYHKRRPMPATGKGPGFLTGSPPDSLKQQRPKARVNG